MAYAEYAEALKKLGLPIVAPLSPPNLEPRDDIWPTELAPVLLRAPGGVELAQMRWGFPARHQRGRPVINFRSEGRNFASSRRCLIPASHFFEFKGKSSPKAKYCFTVTGQSWFCFAGLWRPASEDMPASFTLLTTAPGADVKPIHDRQMAIVDRLHWQSWLDLTAPEEKLLAPLPAGSLQVTRVR